MSKVKIYTKVVIDMATSEIIKEESYLYDGLFAECKSGGTSSSTSVDKAYNARMATLSEEQQDWARYWEDLAEKEYSPLLSAQIESDLQEVELRAPAMKEFYAQSLDGVNAELAATEAGADVQHSYNVAKDELVRDASRLGVNASSGKFATAMGSMATDKARDIAAAKNTARSDAEDTNYARLATAMGIS